MAEIDTRSLERYPGQDAEWRTMGSPDDFGRTDSDRARHGGTAMVDTGPNLVFPPDVSDFNRPYVRFGCHAADAPTIARYICLPCPAGIQFTDGAEYTSISMGKIAAIADITRAGIEGYEDGGMKGAAVGAGRSAWDQATSGGGIGAGILAARAVGKWADPIAQGLEFGSKMTINPRTNTAFTGNTLRAFTFSFKLIGSSKKEVDTIKKIQQYFQEQVYAAEVGGEKVMLRYPNQWRIEFMDPGTKKELTHVPKIYTTYLTSCSTQVNATGATFRKDMSPIEVDVSLAFQETKILTRDELHRLNEFGDRLNADTALNAQAYAIMGKTVNRILEKGEQLFTEAVDPGNTKTNNTKVPDTIFTPDGKEVPYVPFNPGHRPHPP